MTKIMRPKGSEEVKALGAVVHIDAPLLVPQSFHGFSSIAFVRCSCRDSKQHSVGVLPVFMPKRRRLKGRHGCHSEFMMVGSPMGRAVMRNSFIVGRKIGG